jgi:PKD repeat protein
MNGSCIIEVIPAPSVFQVSGPAFFCENSSGAIISLDNSEAGVTYELLKNGASLTPAVTLPGIGTQLDFPPQTQEGTYTVYAYEDDCDNMMDGAVIVAEKPAPEPEFSFSGLCQWLPTSFDNNSMIATGSISEYHWDFDDGGATSSEENPIYTFSNFGDFDVSMTAISDFGCEDEIIHTVSIEEGINADAGNDEEINYGTSTTLSGSASGGSGNFTYHWEPADKVVNPNSATTETMLLEADQTFTLTVEDSQSECYGENSVTINVKGGPLRADPSASSEFVCSGDGINLYANAAGGNETYTYNWTSDPSGWNFDIANPAINALNQSTTFFVVVDDGFNDVTESVYVSVKDNPEIFAGADQAIPYDYFTQLQCDVTGGGTSFDFEWTPADSIDGNNTISNPVTTPLRGETNFFVTVRNEFGCMSVDDMWVELSGGPLAANPSAQSAQLCQYDTLHLFSGASGGGQPHSYEWTVIPGDGTVISTDENPEIILTEPGEYIYHLTLKDLQNEIHGEVPVTVNITPGVDLLDGFDSIVDIDSRIVAVCVYDTILLNAGNSGFEYVWSNGSNEQNIYVGSTGIGFDMQEYFVDVFNSQTGCATSDTIRIIYSFAMCSYDIKEFNGQNLIISIYPNPVKNELSIQITGIKKPTQLIISDISGKEYFNFTNLFNNMESSWQKSINVEMFKAGTYLITLISAHDIHTRKIIKR